MHALYAQLALAMADREVVVAAEFPDQSLTVVQGKLFCEACRETLSLKKCVLTQHIKSAKHATGKDRLASKQARENVKKVRSGASILLVKTYHHN